jgi:hypothetical protein
MLKTNISALSIVIALFSFVSCSEDSNPEYDTQTFTTIFDNNQFDASYFPIDMQQTPDGGYVILGGRTLPDNNFTGIYLRTLSSIRPSTIFSAWTH